MHGLRLDALLPEQRGGKTQLGQWLAENTGTVSLPNARAENRTGVAQKCLVEAE